MARGAQIKGKKDVTIDAMTGVMIDVTTDVTTDAMTDAMTDATIDEPEVQWSAESRTATTTMEIVAVTMEVGRKGWARVATNATTIQILVTTVVPPTVVDHQIIEMMIPRVQ